MRIFIAIAIFGSLSHARQGVVFRGTVTDASTREPIPAVNIRVEGTSMGTISGADGTYNLKLEPDSQRIVFSHLAYESDSIRVAEFAEPGPARPARVVSLDISLTPATIEYPEVVVLAEDPALEIIRKAIASKRAWMDRLQTYRFDAYTRQTILRDTGIAGVSEAYSTGFAFGGDTVRERVVQKRQTENIPMDENFAAVRRIINFNDDRILLFNMRMGDTRRSYTFTGPTAPDALDNYDYRLLKTRRVRGVERYEIEMKPKTRTKPLLSGTITISGDTWAVVGVDVVPNETFNIPFLKDTELRYSQQFALYDSIFWMPADVRIEGAFSVTIMGFSLPRIGFRQVSSIYDYGINVPVPDSIRDDRRVETDSLAGVIDSSFWSTAPSVPLTAGEQTAYGTLDSTQTLQEQFAPKGGLSDIGEGIVGSILEYIDARFTRVEGFYLGAKAEETFGDFTLGGLYGYGFSDKKDQFAASAAYRIVSDPRTEVGVSGYERRAKIADGGYYGPEVNSAFALLDKNDYMDYYRTRGWSAHVSVSDRATGSLRLSFLDERQTTMPVVTQYSFIAQSTPYRDNPAIAEGRLRSFVLEGRLGREPVVFDVVTNDVIDFRVEHSSPEIARSDFDFTSVSGSLTWSFTTFSGDFLFAPYLRVRTAAGKVFRDIPPQKQFSVDTRSSGIGPFGVLRAARVKEYQGDGMVAVAVEHNFRSVPFLALNIPFLYRNGIEILWHGAAAQTWVGSTPLPGGWHLETGLGIGRIFDLVRFDATYRIREPRKVFFTIAVTSFM